MFRPCLPLAIAGALVLGGSSVAMSEPSDGCLDKLGRIAGKLGDDYDERMQLMLEAQGRMYVILIAPDGGTWTILRVSIPSCEVTGTAGRQHIALPLIGERL